MADELFASKGGTHRENFLRVHNMKDDGHSLEELSKVSHVPLSTLQEVYDRGIGAYKTQPSSVRLKGSYVKGVDAPMSAKLSKEQWAMARVYSFLDGNPKHDNDLRQGGHRPFPEQFSKPVRKVLSAISMGTPNVVGSSEDHRVMYSADYDLMEEVPLTAANVRAFQRLVKGLGRVGKVTDIKIGEVKEWNLMKGAKYDQKRELAHLNELWRSKVITSKELSHAKDLLKPHLTVPEKLRVRKELRFGVLRWTPSDVATGHIQYRGQTFYLPTVMKSSGITKVDVVAWVKDRYVEVSNIILWLKRKGVPYAHLQSLKKGLAEDILLYEDDGNYIQVAKRMLSLAKAEGHKTDEGKLIALLNSELGAVYTIVSDLEVLEEFPQATVPAKRREELDLMRDRMAKLFFRQFDHVMDPKKLLPQLKEVLQDGTKALMEKEHLLPIAKHYRP